MRNESIEIGQMEQSTYIIQYGFGNQGNFGLWFELCFIQYYNKRERKPPIVTKLPENASK